MKCNKSIRFLLIIIALISIQPVFSFENEGHQLTSVSERLEDVALWKTKSSKALVSQEISITCAEQTFLYSSVKASLFTDKSSLVYRVSSVKGSYFLLDFRSILSKHIFPFHFFL